MKRQIVKNAIKVTLGITSLLVLVLAVHIYLVTRPGKVDEQTISMARFDFNQDIDQADAGEISQWLSSRHGVVHTRCNPEANNIVFTYRPVQSDPDQLVKELNSSMQYAAVRHVPDAAALMSGCPMKSPSFLTRIAAIF